MFLSLVLNLNYSSTLNILGTFLVFQNIHFLLQYYQEILGEKVPPPTQIKSPVASRDRRLSVRKSQVSLHSVCRSTTGSRRSVGESNVVISTLIGSVANN